MVFNIIQIHSTLCAAVSKPTLHQSLTEADDIRIRWNSAEQWRHETKPHPNSRLRCSSEDIWLALTSTQCLLRGVWVWNCDGFTTCSSVKPNECFQSAGVRHKTHKFPTRVRSQSLGVTSLQWLTDVCGAVSWQLLVICTRAALIGWKLGSTRQRLNQLDHKHDLDVPCGRSPSRHWAHELITFQQSKETSQSLNAFE